MLTDCNLTPDSLCNYSKILVKKVIKKRVTIVFSIIPDNEPDEYDQL